MIVLFLFCCCCWYVGYENETSRRVVSYPSFRPNDMISLFSGQFRWILIPLVSPKELMGRSNGKKKNHNYDCLFSCCWFKNKTSRRVISCHSYRLNDMLAAFNVQFRWSWYHWCLHRRFWDKVMSKRKKHNCDCSFSCSLYVWYEKKTSRQVVSYPSYRPNDMLAAFNVQIRWILNPLVSPKEVLGRSNAQRKWKVW